MITAIATQRAWNVQLEIVRPDDNSHQFITVHDMSEAERKSFILFREYIITKLTSWLKLRRFAFNKFKLNHKSVEAARLLVLLGYYEHASLGAVCRVVWSHHKAIEALTPAGDSPQYRHYHNIIKPVIDYCRENGGIQ